MASAPRLLDLETTDHKRYFFDKLGLTERLLERCLGEALSAGGDFADLYFEAVTSTSLGMDEGILKTASQGISVGCGVRVLSGERTGFAYTDDLSADPAAESRAHGGFDRQRAADTARAGLQRDAHNRRCIRSPARMLPSPEKLKLTRARGQRLSRDFDTRASRRFVRASMMNCDAS